MIRDRKRSNKIIINVCKVVYMHTTKNEKYHTPKNKEKRLCVIFKFSIKLIKEISKRKKLKNPKENQSIRKQMKPQEPFIQSIPVGITMHEILNKLKIKIRNHKNFPFNLFSV